MSRALNQHKRKLKPAWVFSPELSLSLFCKNPTIRILPFFAFLGQKAYLPLWSETRPYILRTNIAVCPPSAYFTL